MSSAVSFTQHAKATEFCHQNGIQQYKSKLNQNSSIVYSIDHMLSDKNQTVNFSHEISEITV